MVIGLLVGAILGFIAGTRGRQILASMTQAFSMVAALTLKIPPSAEGDEDGDDGRVDEAMPTDLPDIEEFLSTDVVSQIEDHPEVEVNPIILYQVKIAKEKAREERQAKYLAELRDKYIAEGLSEDEIVERLLEGGKAEEKQRQNALAMLISVGASVTPGAGRGNADSVALQDRRRQMKNVESYLANSHDIDVRKSKAVAKANASGVKMKNAYEIARETEFVSYDGGAHERSKGQPRVAKEARNLFREWKQKNPNALPEVHNDSDDEKEKPKEKQARRGGGAVDAAALANLQAEFAEVEMDELEDDEENPRDNEGRRSRSYDEDEDE